MAEGDDSYSWAEFRDRCFAFGRNLVRFERSIEALTKGQAEQQKILNDLARRVDRLEAQQDIIIRLLTSRSADLKD